MSIKISLNQLLSGLSQVLYSKFSRFWVLLDFSESFCWILRKELFKFSRTSYKVDKERSTLEMGSRISEDFQRVEAESDFCSSVVDVLHRA